MCNSSSLYLSPDLELSFDLKGKDFCLVLVTFNHKYGYFSFHGVTSVPPEKQSYRTITVSDLVTLL
jgi:hypothetical protein